MNVTNKISLILFFWACLTKGILAHTILNSFPVDSAQLLLNQSNKLEDVGNYIQSLQATKALHNYRLRHYQPNDLRILASYSNLINAYMLVSDFDSVEYFMDQAEEFQQKYGITNGIELSSLYSNIGLVKRYQGDYLDAENYYLQAEKCLTRQDKMIDKEDLVMIYIRIAIIKRLLHKTEEALEYYHKSLDLLDNKKNIQLTISCLTGTALVYSDMEVYDKSLEFKLKALKLARSDSINNGLQLAVLYNNLGYDYILNNNLTSAERNLLKSIAQFTRMNYKGIHSANAYENLGLLSEKKQDFQNALAYYQKAIKDISPDFQPVNDIECPSSGELFPSPTLLNILKTKSNCLFNIYLANSKFDYLEEAINTSIIAIQVIDEMRNSYQSYESKLQIANDEYDIYRSTLSLLVEASGISGDTRYDHLAFRVSEKSKSALLLASIRELDARKMGGIPDNLLGEEKNLSQLITQYKNNIYNARQETKPENSMIKIMEDSLFEIQEKHKNLIETFEKKYPEYYSLKLNNEVISVKELQNVIPRNTSMIEYSLSDDILYIFLITSNSFRFYSYPIDSSFNKLISQYVSQFYRFDFSKQSITEYRRFCSYSHSLYKILIEPIESYIKGDKLLIVPDGILSYLPFETLIKESPQENESSYYKSLKYLLFDYTISYNYSSSLYCEINKGDRKKKANKLLAFAPEYISNFDASQYLAQFITRQNLREELYPIPGAIDEVKAIQSLIKSDVFIGKQATESNFRKIVSNYDILHLAMHAVIDNRNPLYSKLVFSSNNDSTDDGLLNTYEIFNLQLNARMVVLSACNTGQGEYSQGEGVMSLARGFVYAGSPSLVMTMWEVDDKSGSILMKFFYENLLKGQSKAEALRNAKIRFLDEARPENIHPFFWSSFVITGNTQPLYGHIKLYYMLGTAGLISILLLIILFRRSKQTRKVQSS